MCSRVCFLEGDKPGNKVMRKAILGAASALALASPAVAADLSVTPRYSEVPSYEREYQYRTTPHVVVEDRSSRFRDFGGSPSCHCSAAASGG